MWKIIIIILGAIPALFATIINVPVDSSSIQAGIIGAVDGDTVLVQPGTYYENINYSGKNLIVGSLTMTTGDTSFISQTVIDGDSSGSVVTFENDEDLTAELNGFTITNGSAYAGGGIRCWEASPYLTNVVVIGNTAEAEGGGIYIYARHPILKNATVNENTAQRGGGIFSLIADPHLETITVRGNSVSGQYCKGGGIYISQGNDLNDSSASLIDVIVSENTASGSQGEGGGIFLKGYQSTVLRDVIVNDNVAYKLGGGISINGFQKSSLMNVTISGNMAKLGGGIYNLSDSTTFLNVVVSNNTAFSTDAYSGGDGGGIYLTGESSLENVLVKDNIAFNDGGGIYFSHSNSDLSNVTVRRNSATWGGGIWFISSSPTFSDDNRCNIYLNSASTAGNDMYTWDTPIITVVVDTFTVMEPTEEHAYPLNSFTFEILHDTSGVTLDLAGFTKPLRFEILKNYPNPFNPSTTIRFDLPEHSNVRLSIYDVMGRERATLLDQKRSAGSYSIQWNGTDDSGKSVSTGVYFARMQAGEYSQTIKMLYLK